jgi:PAS domain S-box-containing protein/diguanylate cyclase (GGDEF)-like protein
MTSRDDLTGLPTRAGLLHWLTHAHAVSVPAGGLGGAGDQPAAVLAVVDIEDFAGVNVEYGEALGDEVLRALGRRLQELAGTGGIAARVGGDTFVVGARSGSVEPHELGRRVLETVRQPVALGDREAIVGGNVAVAVCGVEEPVASVLRRLELALDRARRRGGQTVVVADALEEDRFSAALATDLHHALERDEVRVHYLPVVALAEGAVVGVEALARWHRADEVLDTDQFLGLALKTGQMVDIGRYVIERACQAVARWNAAHDDHPPLRLSVNVSFHQLVEPDSVANLAALLDASGLDPALVCLEMSEDSLSELGEAAGPILLALKQLGVRLSVDDFGTGASSLVALRRHRFDELKIDRSFVAQMDHDDDAAAIVRGVARLARSLGIELVAEGVERPAQEQMLRSLRCQAAQGWLYARPHADLEHVVARARDEAAASVKRQPVQHSELWAGMPTALTAARFVETVFETAPIGMALIDHTGRHLAANPSIGALLGHSVSALLGQTCWELIHPADLQADLNGMDSLLRGECTSYVVEERVIGADGAQRWVEVTVSGLPGEHQAHGDPTRLLRQVRSIEDDRRTGEDAAVLRSIIDASPDALVITDGDGRCTHWNPTATRMFGWTATDMVGQPLSRLVAGDDQLALARVLGEAATGRAVRWPDATWVSSSGASCCVDVTVGPIEDVDGQVLGLVALARDVTAQRAADLAMREAHEALRARAGDLAAANDRLATFASTLAHDLLQPVAGLDGFLSLLDAHASELTDEHRDWLHRAMRGKARLADAIGALHRHAFVEDLALEPVPLDEVVDELLVELRGGADDCRVEVGALPTVQGDRGLVAQVLANLVQNALRYRADDRPLHVRIDATPAGACWDVAVTDTGRGIGADELTTIFERGVRGRSSAGTDGTGTGLATVRSLVQRMGGEVWAEPHEGGACLCVRLPAADLR